MNEPLILGGAFVFTLMVGVFTGLFPAAVLSKFNVVDAVKSGLMSSDNKSSTRGVLVVFQFCISIILIIGTLTIYRQLKRMQSKGCFYP